MVIHSDATLGYVVGQGLSQDRMRRLSGDTVTFASSLSGQTVSAYRLTIHNNITITGLGAANLSIAGYGGVTVNSGATAILSGGNDGDSSSGSNSGVTNNGTLTLTNSVVSGNTAYNQGAGINNSGVLTLGNDTITNNLLYEGFSGPGQGVGIYNSGTLTIYDSTLFLAIHQASTATPPSTSDPHWLRRRHLQHRPR